MNTPITIAQFTAVVDAMTTAGVFDEVILSRLLERLSPADRKEMLARLSEERGTVP